MQCISRITFNLCGWAPTCSVRKLLLWESALILLLARDHPSELCAHELHKPCRENYSRFQHLRCLFSTLYCVRATGHFRGLASFKTRATDNSKNNYVLFTRPWDSRLRTNEFAPWSVLSDRYPSKRRSPIEEKRNLGQTKRQVSLKPESS